MLSLTKEIDKKAAKSLNKSCTEERFRIVQAFNPLTFTYFSRKIFFIESTLARSRKVFMLNSTKESF